MGILLCEQNFRDVWIRNKSVRAEIGQILRTHTQTHTHTTAAKLVVRIGSELGLVVNMFEVILTLTHNPNPQNGILSYACTEKKSRYPPPIPRQINMTNHEEFVDSTMASVFPLATRTFVNYYK